MKYHSPKCMTKATICRNMSDQRIITLSKVSQTE